MPEPYVHAPLPSESITFLALMRLPLPPGLSDSAVCSNICLSLVAWMIHGPLGFRSLHPISFSDWALLGCRLSLFYLAHVPFCLAFVDWLVLLPRHYTTPTMISLILLPIITSRLTSWSTCHINFLYYLFFWTLLLNIPAGLAHFMP